MQPETSRTIDMVMGIVVFAIGVAIVIYFVFVKNDIGTAGFLFALLGAPVWLYDRHYRRVRKRNQTG